jgi:hypothetical protein
VSLTQSEIEDLAYGIVEDHIADGPEYQTIMEAVDDFFQYDYDGADSNVSLDEIAPQVAVEVRKLLIRVMGSL